MKNLINKIKGAASRLTLVDAIMWGQMILINIIAAKNFLVVKMGYLFFWGVINTILSSVSLVLIFNAVKF